MKILVIDDNRDLAEGLSFVLEDAGHEVLVAFTGEQGLKAFRDGAPDVVLLDYKLPDMNGIDVYRACLAHEPAARIVLMSAYRIEQLVKHVINADVRVLRKPFTMEEVLHEISRIGNAGIVLVVDDDEEFSEGIAQLLEERGQRVLIARDGRTAIEQAMKHPVAVMILDLRLPVMHGVSVYLELRTLGRAIPTIIVTAYGAEEREAIDMLHSPSVTGVLCKPFEPERLLEMIDTIKKGDLRAT